MSESSLADGDAEQETGIQVDLDADDGKAVTRVRPRAVAAPRTNDRASERLENNREFKKRFTRIENRFNQQLAEQQAEFQRQLAARDAKINALSRTGDSTSSDEAAHEKAMEAMQAELEEAQERGDSKAVAAITRKMSQADAKFWAAQTSKQTQGASENPTRTQTQAAQTAQDQKPKGSTKAGVEWAKANGDWWNDTADEVACDAREFANSLHKRMVGDGSDPETPEHFEEIRKQVQKRFPEIETKSTLKNRRGTQDDPDDADGDDDVAPARRAAPSLPNRGAATRSQELRTLTRADIATMRSVHMDPNNDKHVLQFLRSKREEEADA